MTQFSIEYEQFLASSANGMVKRGMSPSDGTLLVML
jgi:hypothetical protein